MSLDQTHSIRLAYNLYDDNDDDDGDNVQCALILLVYPLNYVFRMHRKHIVQKHQADLRDELSLGKLDQIGCLLLQQITDRSVGDHGVQSRRYYWGGMEGCHASSASPPRCGLRYND